MAFMNGGEGSVARCGELHLDVASTGKGCQGLSGTVIGVTNLG